MPSLIDHYRRKYPNRLAGKTDEEIALSLVSADPSVLHHDSSVAEVYQRATASNMVDLGIPFDSSQVHRMLVSEAEKRRRVVTTPENPTPHVVVEHEDIGWGRGMINGWARGGLMGKQTQLMSLGLLQSGDKKLDRDDIEAITKVQKELQSIPASEEFREFNRAEGFWDSLGEWASSPVQITSEAIAESFSGLLKAGVLGGYDADGNYIAGKLPAAIGVGATSGAGIGAVGGAAGAGAGAGIGAGAGAISGMALTSHTLEATATYLDAFREAKVDTTNTQALLNAINDPKTREKARDIAQKKGMVVGVFDGVTAGIAGRGVAVLQGIIKPVAPKLAAKPVGKLGSWTAEMGIQMGGGMAGEAVGSVAAGQPIHAPSVLIEGFAELGTGAVEVGVAKAFRGGSKDAGAEETTMLRQIKKYLDDGGTVEGAKKIIDDTKIAYEGQLDTASRSSIFMESKEKGKETRVQEFDEPDEARAWAESEEAEGRDVNLISKEKAAKVEKKLSGTEAPPAEKEAGDEGTEQTVEEMLAETTSTYKQTEVPAKKEKAAPATRSKEDLIAGIERGTITSEDLSKEESSLIFGEETPTDDDEDVPFARKKHDPGQGELNLGESPGVAERKQAIVDIEAQMGEQKPLKKKQAERRAELAAEKARLEVEIEHLEAPLPEEVRDTAAVERELERINARKPDFETAERFEAEFHEMQEEAAEESNLSAYRKLANDRKRIEAKKLQMSRLTVEPGVVPSAVNKVIDGKIKDLKAALKKATPNQKDYIRERIKALTKKKQGERTSKHASPEFEALNRQLSIINADMADLESSIRAEADLRMSHEQAKGEKVGRKTTEAEHPNFLSPTEREKRLDLDRENWYHARIGDQTKEEVTPERTRWVGLIPNRSELTQPMHGESELKGYPSWLEILRRNMVNMAHRYAAQFEIGSRNRVLPFEWAASAVQDIRANIAAFDTDEEAMAYAMTGWRKATQMFRDNFRIAKAGKRPDMRYRVEQGKQLDDGTEIDAVTSILDDQQFLEATQGTKASRSADAANWEKAREKLQSIYSDFFDRIRMMSLIKKSARRTWNMDLLRDDDISSERLYRQINNIIFQEAARMAFNTAVPIAEKRSLKKQMNRISKEIRDLNSQYEKMTTSDITRRVPHYRRVKVFKTIKLRKKSPEPMSEQEIAVWEEANKPIQMPDGSWEGYENIEAAAKEGRIKLYQGKPGVYQKEVIYNIPFAREEQLLADKLSSRYRTLYDEMLNLEAISAEWLMERPSIAEKVEKAGFRLSLSDNRQRIVVSGEGKMAESLRSQLKSDSEQIRAWLTSEEKKAQLNESRVAVRSLEARLVREGYMEVERSDVYALNLKKILSKIWQKQDELSTVEGRYNASEVVVKAKKAKRWDSGAVLKRINNAVLQHNQLTAVQIEENKATGQGPQQWHKMDFETALRAYYPEWIAGKGLKYLKSPTYIEVLLGEATATMYDVMRQVTKDHDISFDDVEGKAEAKELLQIDSIWHGPPDMPAGSKSLSPGKYVPRFGFRKIAESRKLALHPRIGEMFGKPRFRALPGKEKDLLPRFSEPIREGSMSVQQAEERLFGIVGKDSSIKPLKTLYDLVLKPRLAEAGTPEGIRVHALRFKDAHHVGAYFDNNIILDVTAESPVEMYEFLMEEVLHSLTVDRAKKPWPEMEELMETVKAHALRSNWKFTDGSVQGAYDGPTGDPARAFNYELNDIREFVARAFTNKDFQNFLKSIQYESKGFLETAWEKFVKAVKAIFGRDVADTTAFDAIDLTVPEFQAEMPPSQIGEGRVADWIAEGRVGPYMDDEIGEYNLSNLKYDAIVDDALEGKVTEIPTFDEAWPSTLIQDIGKVASVIPPLPEGAKHKLTKKFFLTLKGGEKLTSNLWKTTGEPVFSETVAPLNGREAQWKRIVAAGVNGRMAFIEETLPPMARTKRGEPKPWGSSSHIPDLANAKTASEALDIISKQSPLEDERMLAKGLAESTRLSVAGDSIPLLTAKSRKAFIRRGGSKSGGAMYHTGKDAITFDEERSQVVASLYLHEISHASTSKAVKFAREGWGGTELPPANIDPDTLTRAQKAVVNLEFLRKAIELNVQSPPGQVRSGLEYITERMTRASSYDHMRYGLKDVDEFIAESHSNWDFRQALQSVKLSSLELNWPFPADAQTGTGMQTAWDALVKLVSELLGLGSNESTVLEEVMRQSEELMKLPIDEYRQEAWMPGGQKTLFSPPPRKESDLTPAELLDKARGHMEPPPAAEPAHGWFSRLYQNFITKSEFAQMMEEKVHETSNYSGIPMLGLREMHELLNGAPQKAFHLVGNFTKAIHDIIGKKREGEFNTYLFLKRADSRLRTDFANQQRLEELNDKIETSRLRNPEDALTVDEKLELIALEVSSKQVGNWTQQGIARALSEMENQHGAETMAKFAEAQSVFTAYTDESLFRLVESGRIGLNTYLRMRKSNEFYAPFFVAQYFDATETSLLEYIRGIRNADFSLVPIMDATKYKLYNSIMVGEHNKFSLQMSRLAEVDTSGSVIQEFETEDRRNSKIDAWNESVSETIAKLKDKLAKADADGDTLGANAIEQEIQRHRHTLKNHPKVTAPDGWRKIDVWEEGRRKNYILKEEYHSAFSSVIPPDTEGGLGAIISPLTDLFKMGATGLNLFFQFFNATLVDPIRIMTSSRAGLRLNDAKSLGINFIMQYFRGFAASMWANIPASRGIIDNTGERGMGKLVQGFIDSGAAGSTISDYLQKEQIRNPLKRKKQGGLRGEVQKVWDWGTTKVDQLNTLGKVLEHTAKLVGYQRLMDIEGATKLSQKIEATKDSEKKAALEKELDEKMRRIAIEIRNYVGSPDFARRGTATEAWQLNLVFMFFNARVQGVERDFHRLGGIVRKGDRSDGIKMALKLTSMAAIPSVLIWAMNRRDDYDEDYDKISPEDKRHYFHIPMDKWFTHPWTGEKVREYIRIPRRETFGLVSYLAEGMLEHMVNEDPKAVNEMIAALAEGIIPVNIQSEKGGLELDPWGRFESVLSSLNPVIKTPIEIVSNRNFYHHGDVIRKSLKAAPAHEQYYNNTPDLYRNLAGIIGASPLRVQHGIRGMTAGLVSQFIPDKDIDDRPGLMKVPFAKRLFRSKYLNPTDDMRAMEDYVTDSAGGAAVRHRLVDAFWTRTRELNPRDRARAAIVMLSGMEASHDTMLVKRELVKRFREMNLSRDERMLKTLPVEARAGFILDKMMSMPADERREYWLNLHSKKIVTRDVAGTILRELRPLGGAQALFPSQ